MKNDMDIAYACKMKKIKSIAQDFDIPDNAIETYGEYKAKIDYEKIQQKKDSAKLILVTAINPTPAGEGKTTTTIGLGQAMNQLNKKTMITLREPSLGPVMGIKGGAAGGGYSQVVPMEDINLHFTGDLHAITSANNLISAAIDNHIHQGNTLQIDIRTVTWKRCLDMNDRALRNVLVGLGGKINGFPREDSFTITAASEIMAILCLSKDLTDLKQRIKNTVIGNDNNKNPITVGDLEIEGAVATLLKDAIKPNLVQTLENTPAFIHGGPFANIAHGCNSVIATKTAMKLSDYVITEAGFGSDLGAEKFFDIKCRTNHLKPDAVVLVATVRSLKYNGGVDKKSLTQENIEALTKGFSNLEKHLDNMKKFNVPVVVAINRFSSDSDDEINTLQKLLEKNGTSQALADVYTKGGSGGLTLAKEVLKIIESNTADFKPLYDLDQPISEKISIICKEIYGAKAVVFSDKAMREIRKLEKTSYKNLPICMAKTQYSLSDNPALLGKPTGFDITVSDIVLKAGAGFIVVLTGNIMTMPGLPKKPAAENMDIDKEGIITGLF